MLVQACIARVVLRRLSGSAPRRRSLRRLRRDLSAACPFLAESAKSGRRPTAARPGQRTSLPPSLAAACVCAARGRLRCAQLRSEGGSTVGREAGRPGARGEAAEQQRRLPASSIVTASCIEGIGEMVEPDEIQESAEPDAPRTQSIVADLSTGPASLEAFIIVRLQMRTSVSRFQLTRDVDACDPASKTTVQASGLGGQL